MDKEFDDLRLKFNLKYGSPMDILMGYKPKSTEELAEWILMAFRNLVDEEGKRIYIPLKPFMGYQIAKMMQMAELKVPKDKQDD